MNKLKFYWEKLLDLVDPPCRHSRVTQFQDGNYCPDCGEKIKFTWIVIKCQVCRSLRMPKVTDLGDIIPLHKHCTKCGSDRWYSEKRNHLNSSQGFYAIPFKSIIEEQEEFLHEGENNNIYTTDIWIEEPEEDDYKKF